MRRELLVAVGLTGLTFVLAALVKGPVSLLTVGLAFAAILTFVGAATLWFIVIERWLNHD